MDTPLLSVIIATRNRPQKLRALLANLVAQSLAQDQFEVVVVDDGSNPPVQIVDPRVRIVRQNGVERCRARNSGAEAARGDWLVFVDDDMQVAPEFLAAHLEAQRRWKNCLVIGAVHLPPEVATTPFGRFRGMEDQGDWPADTAPGKSADFCTAQNMSLGRAGFLALGGFDADLVVSEDQDMGLRWLQNGGDIGFLPAAHALHDDNAPDIRSYCKRMEWGQRHQVAFARKYPGLPSSQKRAKVNGPLRLGRDPLPRSGLKLLKSMLGLSPLTGVLFAWTDLLERRRASAQLLQKFYKLMLAIHLQRGW